MPWKRRDYGRVTPKQALLLAALAVAGGALACWLGAARERAACGAEDLMRSRLERKIVDELNRREAAGPLPREGR